MLRNVIISFAAGTNNGNEKKNLRKDLDRKQRTATSACNMTEIFKLFVVFFSRVIEFEILE